MSSNVDLILGGMNSASQAIKPYADRQLREEERATPLTRYERAVAMVLQGRIHPKEAAIRMQLGLPFPDEQQAPQQEPQAGTNRQEGGSGMYAGLPNPAGGGGTITDISAAGMGPVAQSAMQMGQNYQPPQIQAAPRQWPAMPAGVGAENKAPEPAPSYGYNPGQMGQAQEPIPYPPMQGEPQFNPIRPGAAMDMQAASPMDEGPRTRGDLALLQSMQGLAKPVDTPQDKMMRALVMANSREKVAGQGDATKRRGQDITGSLGAAGLTEKGRQSDNQITLGYDRINAMMEIAQDRIKAAERILGTKGGQNLKLEALKLRVKRVNAIQAFTAKLLDGLGNLADSPGVREAIKDFQSEASFDAKSLAEDLLKLQGVVPTTPGSPAPLGVTGNAPAGPDGYGPPLDGAPIGEPDANVEPAMTPRRSSASSSSRLKMKGPAAKKIRVRDTKTGAEGNVSENNPGLKDGTYERIANAD